MKDTTPNILCTAQGMANRVFHTVKNGWMATTAALILVSGVGTSTSVNAEEETTRWYKAEYLVFKYLSPQTSEALDTTERLTPNDSPEYYLVNHKPQTPYQLKRIPDDKLSMQATAKRLKRAAGYRVLDLGGWYQPLYKRDDKLSVHIEGGEIFGDQPELQGTLTFYRNRYIHVRADMALSTFKLSRNESIPFWLTHEEGIPSQDVVLDWYGLLHYNAQPDEPTRSEPLELTMDSNDPRLENNEEKPDEDSTDNIQSGDKFPTLSYVLDKTWKISESRKLRSGELHLLDHPYFGILVSFDLVELPSQQTSPESGSEQN